MPGTDTQNTTASIRVAVSIINYRTADLTIAAVKSARDDLGDRSDARIVVVDNASGDGSAEAIETWMAETGDPRLSLVRSSRNSGFSAGHNQGLNAVPGAEYYLILNSDALLHPGFFDAILAAADSHPEAGLFAPEIDGGDDEIQHSCFRAHGPASELIRAARTGIVSRILARHVIHLPLPPDPEKIEWASFACILLRSEMIDDIGQMDDGYFLYFEDSEYCVRARRGGWKIMPVPGARATHFRGGSGPIKTLSEERKRLPPFYWRARNRFLRQTHGPLGPVTTNLAWCLGRVICRMRPLFGREVRKAQDCEWHDIWIGVLNPLKPDRGPEE